MNVVLICQVGAKVGLGHLSRVLSLALSLQKNSLVKVSLFIQGNKTPKKELGLIPHHFFQCLHDWILALTQLHEKSKIDFVVFDMSPTIPLDLFSNALSKIKKMGIKIIGIDGFAYDTYCEWIHAPTFYVDQKKIQKTKCPVYYGWDSYLLPKKVEKKHCDFSTWYQNVLILTGGSDVAKLGERWPLLIDAQLPLNATIHWVKGPYAQHPIIPKKTRLSWKIHRSPNSLSELMCCANLALTVYGVSFFELISYHVPTVVYSPYSDRDLSEDRKST